ncbi:MAG: class I SAM-dependent methyltransferase [Anaerolineales bacterium]|jgi:ubiquinone/menaquinone biosynthesis C-methylase UbiE
MTDTILRTNAIPIYGFISFINARQLNGEIGLTLKILDCGAGGQVPPLALFYEHGFEAWGIDISEKQLELAKQYCIEKRMGIDLRKGDMRKIPFDGESFDCVYEHYSMCHLSKKDTALAIGEMRRVTRMNGLCFLGFISMDSWPKSLYGAEREPGEFWREEGEDAGLHCMFTDEEADQFVSDWEVLSKEKRMRYLRDEAERTSMDRWMEIYGEMIDNYSEESWREQYDQRMNMFNYSHMHYILKKP